MEGTPRQRVAHRGVRSKSLSHTTKPKEGRRVRWVRRSGEPPPHTPSPNHNQHKHKHNHPHRLTHNHHHHKPLLVQRTRGGRGHLTLPRSPVRLSEGGQVRWQYAGAARGYGSENAFSGRSPSENAPMASPPGAGVEGRGAPPPRLSFGKNVVVHIPTTSKRGALESRDRGVEEARNRGV